MMVTLFVLLALAGGLPWLLLNRQLKNQCGMFLGVPQALAVALWVLAGLSDLLMRRG